MVPGVNNLLCKLNCIIWQNVDSGIKGSPNVKTGKAKGTTK